MSVNIIQFGQLEEFLTEPFTQNQVVRVVILETSERMSSKIPAWRLIHIGVHVRSINDAGQILACHLPVAALELFSKRRDNNLGWQKYDRAWQEAVALNERVTTYLQNASAAKDFILRTSGVIHIGGIRPLPATWKTDPALLAESPHDVLTH